MPMVLLWDLCFLFQHMPVPPFQKSGFLDQVNLSRDMVTWVAWSPEVKVISLRCQYPNCKGQRTPGSLSTKPPHPAYLGSDFRNGLMSHTHFLMCTKPTKCSGITEVLAEGPRDASILPCMLRIIRNSPTN